MAQKLFIGSLAWGATEDELRELFETVGTVESATIIIDCEIGRLKGFGFVEMGSEEEAKKAVEELNGKELAGRALVVNEARPREDR